MISDFFIEKYINNEPLDAKEEKKLFIKLKEKNKNIKESSKIRNKIVLANMRLVFSIAKKMKKGNYSKILDILDEGILGLIESVDKFDYTKGFKFSTYAYWWISQKIRLYLLNDKFILKASSDLFKLALRIKIYLNINAMDYLDYRKTAKFLNISEERVKRAAPLLQQIISLENPISQNEKFSESPKDKMISNHNSIKEKDSELLTDFIKEFFKKNIFTILNNKENQVIKDRYGFNDLKKGFSLREIGKKMNITAEAVRQIEKKALNKIRKLNIIKTLKDLVVTQ